MEERHFSRLFFNSTICKPFKKQAKTRRFAFLTIFFWNIYVKNLWVKLAASNLFNAKEKGYSEYKGVYTSHWVDTRQPSISLTISYSFNPAKSKYKGKTAGEDELRRL